MLFQAKKKADLYTDISNSGKSPCSKFKTDFKSVSNLHNMYFKLREIVHTEIRCVVSLFCSFPWPSCNKLPAGRPQAAVTPGCVAGSQCHHLTLQLHWSMKRKKFILTDPCPCRCFVCSSFTHFLLVEDLFKPGGRHGALRVMWDEQLSQMSTFSLSVMSQQGAVEWLVSQAARNCCVWTPLRWWQHPWEGVLLWEIHVWEGWIQCTAGKCTCERVSSAHPSPLKSLKSLQGLHKLTLTDTRYLTRFRTQKWFAV